MFQRMCSTSPCRKMLVTSVANAFTLSRLNSPFAEVRCRGANLDGDGAADVAERSLADLFGRQTRSPPGR